MLRKNPARSQSFNLSFGKEVIEHLDALRLVAFERVLFECARPGTVGRGAAGAGGAERGRGGRAGLGAVV